MTKSGKKVTKQFLNTLGAKQTALQSPSADTDQCHQQVSVKMKNFRQKKGKVEFISHIQNSN